MMRGPARLMAMLAVAAATQVAAASERFVPVDPTFVVANVRQAMPDEKLRTLLDAWRKDSGSDEAVTALAAAFIEHARSAREPMYFGRAEAVLAPRARTAGASARMQRLYAEVLQYRHDFAGAESLLDPVLTAAPRDADARLLRASVRLVRGDFAGARGDCAQLAASGGEAASLGFACLAEALAGSGQMERAQAVLLSAGDGASDPSARAYLLVTRAELHERSGDPGRAIADYRAALALTPKDDSIRAAFADALVANGSTAEARSTLVVDKPSLALLVRSAALAQGAERADLVVRSEAWLDLETARGDAVHNREASMLALANKNARQAVAAARRNFEIQRELPDVRTLARAAMAAQDAGAMRTLRDWLKETGFRDSVTENILGNPGRG